MKRYTGERTMMGCVVLVHDARLPGVVKHLKPRNDVRNHSPDGFNWGYGGSGPAQLALALCCDVLRDVQRAERVYQGVKSRLIAGIVADVWTMTDEQLLRVIYEVERERQGADGDQRKQGYHQGG